MGSLLRSEPLTLIQIIEAKGAARGVVNTIGDLGIVQFRDVRSSIPPLPALKPPHPTAPRP
jgi:hypothetical protein